VKRLILITLLLALAGCGSEAPTTVVSTARPSPASGAAPTNMPTAEVAAQPTAPPAATPTVAATAAAQPTATQAAPAAVTPTVEPTVVAALEKSGGLAGISTQLVVWDDGRLELSGGRPGQELRTGQATPEQVAALRAIVDSPEFQALDDQYMPKDTCCDLFTYVLSAGPRTITTMDGVEWPAPLADAIELMSVLESQVPATK
jgi:hypothetical protein